MYARTFTLSLFVKFMNPATDIDVVVISVDVMFKFASFSLIALLFVSPPYRPVISVAVPVPRLPFQMLVLSSSHVIVLASTSDLEACCRYVKPVTVDGMVKSSGKSAICTEHVG